MAQFVLLPGAGGDPWYWHLVAERLRGSGHRAIAVDLPADDDTAGLAEYADATVAAAQGYEGVVLVAQSLGAFTAAMAARRLPVRAIAFVNAMIPLPGETPGDWWTATGQAEAQLAARADNDPAEDFTHDLPAELVTALRARTRDQAGAVFSDKCDFKSWPAVSLHALVGADDRFFPASFQQRACRERLGLDPTVIPGGHAIALSQPAAVSRWLESIA